MRRSIDYVEAIEQILAGSFRLTDEGLPHAAPLNHRPDDYFTTPDEASAELGRLTFLLTELRRLSKEVGDNVEVTGFGSILTVRELIAAVVGDIEAWRRDAEEYVRSVGGKHWPRDVARLWFGGKELELSTGSFTELGRSCRIDAEVFGLPPKVYRGIAVRAELVDGGFFAGRDPAIEVVGLDWRSSMGVPAVRMAITWDERGSWTC